MGIRYLPSIINYQLPMTYLIERKTKHLCQEPYRRKHYESRVRLFQFVLICCTFVFIYYVRGARVTHIKLSPFLRAMIVGLAFLRLQKLALSHLLLNAHWNATSLRHPWASPLIRSTSITSISLSGLIMIMLIRKHDIISSCNLGYLRFHVLCCTVAPWDAQE